jgi:heat shock protein HspQ
MEKTLAKFSVGQLIRHRLFDYRGVVVDVDPFFQGDDEWYERVARTRPPKNRPWYRVLVHEAAHFTYVAERNLLADDSGKPVKHPALNEWLGEFHDGRYAPKHKNN